MKQISYYISFKPQGHDSIPTYFETDIDIAISKALGIYKHMPFPHEITIYDSNHNLILQLNKLPKNPIKI